MGCVVPPFFVRQNQMAPDGVTAIIENKVKNLEQLGRLAPGVIEWLLKSLPLAHHDLELKIRLKLVLGSEFFVKNLAHLGLWDDLLKTCSDHALDMGKDMKKYFDEHDLGKKLGTAYPNVFGRVERVPPLKKPISRCVGGYRGIEKWP